tara:strand:- start:418 stop:567 length:150 start_codon:yes stop_codon:yes gene_type:complete
MNWFLISGAILSFVGMVFHGFIGGKMYKTNMKENYAYLIIFLTTLERCG